MVIRIYIDSQTWDEIKKLGFVLAPIERTMVDAYMAISWGENCKNHRKLQTKSVLKDPCQKCNFTGDNYNPHMHLSNKHVSKAECFGSVSTQDHKCNKNCCWTILFSLAFAFAIDLL